MQPSFLQRTVARLDGWFIRRHCAGCLVASAKIASQLVELMRCEEKRISLFYPTYNREAFERFLPPAQASVRSGFYAGRIEVEKGVFDLLQSFRQLIAAGKNVQLDYCGDGQALSSLLEAIDKTGLADRVRTKGHLSRPELLDLLAMAQVVVVPTRSSFPEGLNQVVIEARLRSGRLSRPRSVPQWSLLRRRSSKLNQTILRAMRPRSAG